MSSLVDLALGDAAPHIEVSIDEGVTTIAFARPERHNAISYAMWQGLARLMPVLEADDSVDVVLLTGAPGGPFSAGADIAEFRTLRADAEGAAAYNEAVEAGERALIDFSKPTVAAIEGFAIGGGTQVAVACDLRICGAASRFGVTPANLGIVYPLASTRRLVETVGSPWARWLLLTGELVDAATALRSGLGHEVVADAAVPARATELARRVGSRARVSLVGGKALIDRVAHGRLDEDDEVVALYERSRSGPEYAEGVAAFLDKRAPDFGAVRRSTQPSRPD